MDEAFTVVEEMPEFPGGAGEMLNYVSKTLKYPEDAFKNKVQGRVIVSFVISKDGTIKDPKVVHSVHPSLDKEAIRVVQEMPKWKPGKQRGEVVNVNFTMPISFRLQ
ncbi:MAG: energy transducer TonB [Bacteroidaceae bacterium]|nr:energy transducer TonB [Bacteroidaceae bacterium]